MIRMVVSREATGKVVTVVMMVVIGRIGREVAGVATTWIDKKTTSIRLSLPIPTRYILSCKRIYAEG